MFSHAQKYFANFLHLFYPHNCEGCGTDILYDTHFLCARCMHHLPNTGFFESPDNPVEKLFYGRLPVIHAGAAYYFTKDSLLQHLLIQLKYKGNKDAGYFLGRMMGYALQKTEKYKQVNLLVPLPLHIKKEQIRGYNQAALICEGISEVCKIPVVKEAVGRVHFTKTQTHENRLARWQNMDGVFAVTDQQMLQHKHILLIDDVITTGATLEACGSAILKTEGVQLSIAAAAYTLRTRR